MDVSNVIKSIMHVENLNATELCEKANIPNSSLSDYMNGKVSPRFKTFHRMVDNLGYDVLVVTSVGKVYRVADISVCFRHMMASTNVDLQTLSNCSGVTTKHLYDLISGRHDPTIRIVNVILNSSGYRMKVKKRSKNDKN